MIPVLARVFTPITAILFLTVSTTFFLPSSSRADSQTLSCSNVRLEIEQTQRLLRPLEQRQQAIQQNVRTIYQKLFVCQSGRETTFVEQQQCTQLQEEGPTQFQAMVEITTRKHQAFQKLSHQIRQAHLNCAGIEGNTSPKTANQPAIQKIAQNR